MLVLFTLKLSLALDNLASELCPKLEMLVYLRALGKTEARNKMDCYVWTYKLKHISNAFQTSSLHMLRTFITSFCSKRAGNLSWIIVTHTLNILTLNS